MEYDVVVDGEIAESIGFAHNWVFGNYVRQHGLGNTLEASSSLASESTGVLLKELNYNKCFHYFECFTEIVENISQKRPRVQAMRLQQVQKWATAQKNASVTCTETVRK